MRRHSFARAYRAAENGASRNSVNVRPLTNRLVEHEKTKRKGSSPPLGLKSEQAYFLRVSFPERKPQTVKRGRVRARNVTGIQGSGKVSGGGIRSTPLSLVHLHGCNDRPPFGQLF